MKLPYQTRPIGTLRRLLALLGLAVAAMPAAAEVVLSTQIQRVAGDDAGRGMEMLETVTDVRPGDVIRYTIVFENQSAQDVAAGSVVITNPLPDGTVYLDGSATGERTRVSFSVDGESFGEPGTLMITDGNGTRRATAADYRSIRWAYEPRLPAGAASSVSFDVRMR